jgi:hypothetical protein
MKQLASALLVLFFLLPPSAEAQQQKKPKLSRTECKEVAYSYANNIFYPSIEVPVSYLLEAGGNSIAITGFIITYLGRNDQSYSVKIIRTGETIVDKQQQFRSRLQSNLELQKAIMQEYIKACNKAGMYGKPRKK